jgi:hypothetical protein
MSYNIDSIEIVCSANFRISLEKLALVRAAIDEDDIAEGNVFDMIDANNKEWSKINGAYVHLTNFWWYGEGSGRSEDALYALLEEFEGDADLVLTWEGGDSFTGVRLRDGEVTHHEVRMALGEEK